MRREPSGVDDVLLKHELRRDRDILFWLLEKRLQQDAGWRN